MSKLTDSISDYQSRRQDLIAIVQNDLASSAKELFDKYPDMENFGWHQGLEYNDEGYDFGVGVDDWNLLINGDRDGGTDAQRVEVSEFLSQIGEDIYKEVFGEGANVTVTRDGISVEEVDAYS